MLLFTGLPVNSNSVSLPQRSDGKLFRIKANGEIVAEHFCSLCKAFVLSCKIEDTVVIIDDHSCSSI